MDPLALSVSEAAKAAGISRATLYQEIADGRGPRVAKIRRRTVVTLEALTEWLRSLEQTDAATERTSTSASDHGTAAAG